MPPSIDRKEFIRLLGASTAFAILMPCLSSCVSEQEEPPPPQPNNSGNNNTQGGTDTTNTNAQDSTNTGAADPAEDALAVVALSDEQIARDLERQRFFYVGAIIVAQTPDDSFVAVSKACTHRGTTVRYIESENHFFCPNHQSIFDIRGEVQKRPANEPLTRYRVEKDAANNRLLIFPT